MEDDLQASDSGAKDAAQEDAGVPVFALEADGSGRSGDEQAQIAFGEASNARDSAILVVSARGDVDPVTAPELEAELLEAVELGARRVVADLTETSFFDSSATRALVRSDAAAGERHAGRHRLRQSTLFRSPALIR